MYIACLRILLTLGFMAISFASPQAEPPEQPVDITINATPIAAFQADNPSQVRFGSLEFRGGLVLTSPYKSFGGISGLRIAPDGEHFLALSDRATWFRGRIVFEGKRPAGIADASADSVRDGDGKPAPRWDTESIAEDGHRLFVGLERTHNIFAFDFDWKGFPVGAKPVSGPPELKDLPFNQGLEAVVFIPKNFRLPQTLIGFSEHGLTEEGNLKAFLIGGPTPGLFAVKRTDGFDISDASLLPGGDVLILERQYSMQRGVAMRIRRLRLDDIKPGAVVDGSTIIEADSRCQIDNMEALSVNRNSEAETVITILSDNNNSAIQRTVLLQFVLKEK